MVIAFAELSGVGNSLAADSGGVPQFSVSMRATADDGTNSASTTLLVTIPATSTEDAFNDAIISAVESWVNGQHSWTLDRKNFFFQPFRNGS